MPLKHSLIQPDNEFVTRTCPRCGGPLSFMVGLNGIGTWAYCPSSKHDRVLGWHIYDLVELNHRDVGEVIRVASPDVDDELLEVELKEYQLFSTEQARLQYAAEKSAARMSEALNSGDAVDVLIYLNVRPNRVVLERLKRALGLLSPEDFESVGKLLGRINIPRDSIVLPMEVVPGLYGGMVLYKPMYMEYQAESTILARYHVPGMVGMGNLRAIWESPKDLPLLLCTPQDAAELMALNALDAENTAPVIAFDPLRCPNPHPGLIELLRMSGRRLVLWTKERNQALVDVAMKLGADVIYDPNPSMGFLEGYMGAEGIVRELAARAVPPAALKEDAEQAFYVILPVDKKTDSLPPDVDMRIQSAKLDAEGGLWIGYSSRKVLIKPYARTAWNTLCIGVVKGGREILLNEDVNDLKSKETWEELGLGEVVSELTEHELSYVVDSILRRCRLYVGKLGYDPRANHVIGPGWVVYPGRVEKVPGLGVLFGSRYPVEQEILSIETYTDEEREAGEKLGRIILDEEASLSVDVNSGRELKKLLLADKADGWFKSELVNDRIQFHIGRKHPVLRARGEGLNASSVLQAMLHYLKRKL